MLFLSKLRLKNYCRYSDYTFDFTKNDGSPYPYVCFYGPNGIGKSTILEAIGMLSMNTTGRSPKAVLRSMQKYVRDIDYDPVYERNKGFTYADDFTVSKKDNMLDMLIEGTYVLNGQEYVVSLSQYGYERDDLSDLWGENHLLYRQRISHAVLTDTDISMSKFQIVSPKIQALEEIISQVARCPVECASPSGFAEFDRTYATDIIMIKSDQGQDFRIHFKRMSAGERKICKSFSSLLNLMYDLENPYPGDPSLIGWPRILLIDNIVMHVYWDRHVSMIDCLKEQFTKQQIFATTHSAVLITRHMENKNDTEIELMIDLEKINC